MAFPGASDEEIRAAAIEVLAREEYARFRWVEPDWAIAFQRWLEGVVRWLRDLGDASPVLLFLLVAGLALLAVLMIAHIVWSLRVAMRGAPAAAKVASAHTPRDFTAEAERLASGGDTLGACRALQLACLDLLLHRGTLELARHHGNETLRERLRRSALAPALRDELIAAIDALERGWFRDRETSVDLYADWQRIHRGLSGSRFLRSLWPASLGALFVVAVTISIFIREDPLEFSPTSYGTLPNAYGALHDVFAELGAPVERSFSPSGKLPPDATVWWIEPDRICAKLAADPVADDEADVLAKPVAEWDPAPWIRAGGTAVIFASALADCSRATRIGERALPVAAASPDREHDQDEGDDREAPVGRRADWPEQEVTARFLAQPRRLPLPTLTTFGSVPDGFEVVAEADGEPFALEATLGDGRLVLVADSVFLRNLWLDAGDAAPLAFDWARTYGLPRLDEREHGLSDTPSTTAYLVRSPALPVFAGIAATGLLFGWAGASLPRRRVGEALPTPPTLRTYVDSLARLYSRAGDHGEVFERYREHALAQLRAALRLAHDAPPSRVQEVLRERGLDPADIAKLDADFAANASDLPRACAAVDRLLEAAR